MANLHFFTTTQEDFLRSLLLDAIRHISREMDTNSLLMIQIDEIEANDSLKSVISDMQDFDRERLTTAIELYKKFSRIYR